LLARDDLDAVVVTTATSMHTDALLKAARSGKHIFTEKLLAPTVAECEEIIAAAAASEVALVVSLPRLYEASNLAIMRILADGELGRLTYSVFDSPTTAGWRVGCRSVSAILKRHSAAR
jgi:1,5-anhydro-D-fructose reductase (1,5-anhydro-D-mannitol-forming)